MHLDWRRLMAGLIVFLVAAAALAGIVLFWRIVLAPVEIGEVSTESRALARANERVIQMFQWMISTILLMGGGLIGLNWYQSNQRYERDKEDIERRVVRLEQIEERIREYRDDVHGVSNEVLSQVEKIVNNPDGLTAQAQREDSSLTAPGVGDVDQNISNSRGLVGRFLENVYSRDALPPLQRYVERYLSPNPFGNIEVQKKKAVADLTAMLESSLEANVIGEALIDQGISHVARMLPQLSVERPQSAIRIRELLVKLGFGPLSEVTDHEPTD